MALIAHWPLNGNGNDISGNNYLLSNNGATTDTGKIGQCYVTDGISQFFTTSNIIPDTKNYFTLTFWIYPISTGYIMTPSSYGIDHRISYDSTNQRLGVGITEIADVNNRTRVSTTNSLLVNKWSHVVLVMNDLNIKIYINGSLNSEYTETIPVAPYTGVWYWGQRSNSTNWFNGKYNDIRVYNHLLTDMEIQEIARAKILHYTFDDMQEPTTNLIVNPKFNSTSNWSLSTNGGGVFSVSENYAKITMGTTGSYNYLAQNLSKSNTNKTMTLSAKFKNNVVGNCALRLVIFDGGAVPAQPLGIISLDGTGGTVSGSVTAYYSGTATAYRLDILSGSYYGGLSDITIEFTEVQLEEKSYATEFTEGIRIGRANDYSGFFNHSVQITEANTPRWTSNSKIGTGAYIFKPTNTYLKPIETLLATYKDFTVSAWIYFTSEPTDTNLGYIIAQHYGGGGWILSVRGTDEKLQFRHHRDTANGFTTAYNLLSTISLQTNTWYHVAAKDDGTTAKIYINGVENNSFTITTIIPGPSSSSPIIGAFNTVGNAHFDGYIDDVRIYSTALSDKDVKDLYEARAEVERSGILYARDFLSDAEETINLASNTLLGNGWTGTSILIDSVSKTFNLTQTYTSSSTAWYTYYYDVSQYIGKTITISAYYKVLEETNGLLTQFNVGQGNTGTYPYHIQGSDPVDRTSVTTKNYQYLSWTGVINSTGIVGFCFWVGSFSTGGSVTCQVSNVQVEEKAYPTPFVSTYRPAIELPSTLDFAGNEIHETGTANFEDFSTVGITDGLIGYWPMTDGTVRDLSGTGYGTTVNGTVYLNNSRYFDGIDDYINTNFNGRSAWTEPYTVMISVKIPSSYIWNTSYRKNIFGNGSYAGISGLSASGTDNILGFWLRHDSGSFAVDGPAISRDQWVHMVGTWDGVTDLKYYQNGVFVNTSTVTSITGVPDISGWVMGSNNAYSGASGGFMELYLKDAKYFNRALTAEEIAIEYNTMFNNEVQIHESGVLYAKDIIQY
jgi:hypothetical protein